MGSTPPMGLKWRSSTAYILTTLSIAMFTDLFLYGLVIPILPFILSERLSLPHSDIQSSTSLLLGSFAFSSVLLSLPAGIIADKLPSRQLPYLVGITALFCSTVLLWLGQSFRVLILARILQGVAAATVWSIGLALIIDTVGSENLGTAIGSIFGLISVGELVAPVLGGIVYDKAGDGAVFGMGFALLAVDFSMRLLMVEKKIAARYGCQPSPSSCSSTSNEEENENSPLLTNTAKPSSADLKAWKIPQDIAKIYHKLPILYSLSEPRLLTSFLVTFTQACILGTFDATVPTEAQDLFGFTSLQAGLLFIPLVLPYLVLGPLCGKFVDRTGPKLAATFGFLIMIPPFICLRIPHSVPPGTRPNIEIAKFAIILGASSLGMAFVNSPALVEASYVIKQYHLANPGFFGPGGPYAQLYAMNSMFFSLGLTVGPMAAGALRDSVGYGNMNIVVAGLCAVVGVLCFQYLGGPPPKSLRALLVGK